ncbi:MAG: phosphonatase-like hydrolase [Gemmatimonadota bacterium]|nr:MAG: phosphonatase-like hydrolase [Gemmatimonadota bacterium]
MKPRLAVLDMVGTTVEAGPEVAEAFGEAFGRVGVILPVDVVNGVRGRSKKEAVAELAAAYLPELDDPTKTEREIYSTFRSILLARYERASRPVAGAHTALEYLKRHGAHVVLTTGLDRDTANQILRGLDWESLGLCGVVTGDDVERGRPAPDLIHAAMALTGEDESASVLVVGDTISDLEAAARAEAGWSVGVLSGAHTRSQLQSCPHSVILESVAELPCWLDQMGAWS